MTDDPSIHFRAHAQTLETLRKEIKNLEEHIHIRNLRIIELEDTIKQLQGEPAPLADKIFHVVVEGHNVTLLANTLAKNMKATILLYGDQIVDILPCR